MHWRLSLPDEKPGWLRSILTGLAAAAIAALLRLPLQQAIGGELPFVTFFPALLAAAIWGGVGAGLICLGLGCAVAVAFILPHTDFVYLTWTLMAFSVSGGLLIIVGSALSAVIRELRRTELQMKAAEAKTQTLVAELAHRSRNGLAVVMSIVNQSAGKAECAKDVALIVNARLGAMAAAQDEVLRGGGGAALLASLLERTLSPFDLGRFCFQPSPELHVDGETATALALLTHELATNAVKHGALSSPGGKVEVTWNAGAGIVRLLWRERGGPPASEPRTRGFGTRLVDGVLKPHGGRAERRFETDGMVCEMDFPHVALS
jgi:two-component sensor histidine kinase